MSKKIEDRTRFNPDNTDPHLTHDVHKESQFSRHLETGEEPTSLLAQDAMHSDSSCRTLLRKLSKQKHPPAV